MGHASAESESLTVPWGGPLPRVAFVKKHGVKEVHTSRVARHIDIRGRNPEEECSGVSPVGDRKYLVTKLARCDGKVVVDNVDMVGTQIPNVSVLVGIRL